MTTPFAPWKIQIAYLYLPTPKNLLFTRWISAFLSQNWNQCKFSLFLPKFGCRGNSLYSGEISDSIFAFTAPEKPDYSCEWLCL